MILGAKQEIITGLAWDAVAGKEMEELTRKAPKKQTTKLRLQNFEKTFNRNCIMLKNQRLECKHCRS